MREEVGASVADVPTSSFLETRIEIGVVILSIRPMSATEAAAFFRLAADEGVAQTIESGIVSSAEAAELYKRYEDLTPMWQPLESDLLLGGEVDGELIGGVWMRREEQGDEVYAVAMHVSVYPEYRRQGFANALGRSAVEHVRDLWGATKGRAYVLPMNEASRELIRSIGGVHLYTVYSMIFPDGLASQRG